LCSRWCYYAKFSAEGNLIYIKGTQPNVCCENIKKLTDGSFLLFGWDSWPRTWAYKLSAEGDYQWEFRGVQNAYVTAANQMANGDITLLCSEEYDRIHIIVLDSNGNLISVTYKSTNLWMAYDGVVGKNGVIVATGYNYAFVMTKCHSGTYYLYTNSIGVVCNGKYILNIRRLY